MEIAIFQYLGGTITAITNAFITPAAGELIGRLRLFAIAGITIYIILMGVSMVFGTVDAPGRRAILKFIFIGAIVGIALTINVYLSFVVGTFTNIETVLSQAMGQTSGDIYATLDANLTRGLELTSICMQRASDAATLRNPFGGLGWNIAGGVLLFCSTLIMAVGGAAIAAAKLLLSICFAFGPLFVLLLVWPITARFFNNWFGACLNYTLVIVVASIVMSMAMVAFAQMVGNEITDDTNPILIAAEVFALTVFLGIVYKMIQGLAAQLSGGISMAAFSITGAVMDTLKPAAIARNTVDAKSQRRDPQSGQLVNARRHSHLLDGRTGVNKRYREHVKQNMGTNWRGKGGDIDQDKKS